MRVLTDNRFDRTLRLVNRVTALVSTKEATVARMGLPVLWSMWANQGGSMCVLAMWVT
jgi:hypothetical protein